MDDKSLVNNILRSGDTRSFAELVQRYSGMVFSKALGVVHDCSRRLLRLTTVWTRGVANGSVRGSSP
ncbi:MAG: hypothetical protein Q4E32_02745 [Bacteroidales bacterium]|nr:hypothetical protein [Bacteroidales bacterium]